MERHLAAILAADVVGYSRLMEADEPGTIAALTAHREELIEPTIAEHKGGTVKLMAGGPPVNRDFADRIGADGHGLDAPAAVELARGLV